MEASETRASQSRPRDRKRAQNAIERRHSILEGAASVFMAQGFGGTSMDAIATASGVSKMTLYRYYDSKEALFEGLIESRCNEILAVDSKEPIFLLPPDKALPEIARRFLATVHSPETVGLLRIVIGETKRFPALGRLFYDVGPKKNIDALKVYFERFRDHPNLRVDDPQAAAEAFFSIARGYTQLRLLLGARSAPTTDEIEIEVHRTVALFFRSTGGEVLSV
jgi:TetR/AcrR family transcriptional regulator, mexJK operon transcriptional repressor